MLLPSTINLECVHCGHEFPVVWRDAEHLEAMLAFLVGECVECRHMMEILTDEEVQQYLASLETAQDSVVKVHTGNSSVTHLF